LKVSRESVVITANGSAGFIYGLETIRQLLPIAIDSEMVIANTIWEIPAIDIKTNLVFNGAD
jgi:hexosaminidase